MEPPTPSSLPPSPWDNLNPGSIPDEHFAVAWTDAALGCDDIVVDEDIGCREAWRYDVVNLSGQIVAEFDPPEDGFSVPRRLLPFGPGLTLAVTDNDGSTSSNCHSLAWIADAVSGQTTPVARLAWNWIELPQTGQTVELDQGISFGDAIVLPDPKDPGRVFVLGGDAGQYSPPLLGPLLSIPWADPQGEIRRWEGEELVPSDVLLDAWTLPRVPWFARSYLVGGETVIVLGIDAWLLDGQIDEDPAAGSAQPGLDPEPVMHRLLVAWSPDRGVLDARLDLTSVHAWGSIAFSPNADGLEDDATLGTAIWPREDVYGCSPARFSVWDGGSVRGLDGDPELWCAAAGPVFDALGPTFLYWGTSPDGLGQKLVVRHGGQDVWSWDRLRVGLGERRFNLGALERIEPVPEP